MTVLNTALKITVLVIFVGCWLGAFVSWILYFPARLGKPTDRTPKARTAFVLFCLIGFAVISLATWLL